MNIRTGQLYKCLDKGPFGDSPLFYYILTTDNARIYFISVNIKQGNINSVKFGSQKLQGYTYLLKRHYNQIPVFNEIVNLATSLKNEIIVAIFNKKKNLKWDNSRWN